MYIFIYNIYSHLVSCTHHESDPFILLLCLVSNPNGPRSHSIIVYSFLLESTSPTSLSL
jgi:hypothetical protein